MELEPGLDAVFAPLPPGSSLTVAAMACRQLAAYFETEADRGPTFRAHAFGFDPNTFKEFWRESAQEIEDLGEFIRESVGEWARRKGGRRGCRPPSPPSPPTPPTPPEPPGSE
jgi:hypothetical protein